MKIFNRISIGCLLIILTVSSFAQPSLAASKSKKKTTVKRSQKIAAPNPYFHKRKPVHKKAPIPKDPKPTRIDLKKAKQQKIAGAGYVKQLKGWISKKKSKRARGTKKRTSTKR